MDSLTINLGGREFTVARARLGLFLDLEIVLSRMDKAVEKDGTGDIADALFEYLSVCIPELDRGSFNETPWHEIVNAYASLIVMNKMGGDFAIITRQIGKTKPVPWDYPERVKTLWVHMLASAYHWSKVEIENLVIEDAIGFIQEIQVDEQMQHEFVHSISEIAYQYDKASKKSKFVPLRRPAWMVLRKELPKTRLAKVYLPQGMIITLEGTPREEIKH